MLLLAVIVFAARSQPHPSAVIVLSEKGHRKRCACFLLRALTFSPTPPSWMARVRTALSTPASDPFHGILLGCFCCISCLPRLC